MKKLVALVLSCVMLLMPVVCYAQESETNVREEVTSEVIDSNCWDFDSSTVEAPLGSGDDGVSTNNISESGALRANPSFTIDDSSEYGLHYIGMAWKFTQRTYGFFTSSVKIRYIGLVYVCGFAYMAKPIRNEVEVYDITSLVNSGRYNGTQASIRSGVKMRAGKDYSVSFKNNTNASGYSEPAFHDAFEIYDEIPEAITSKCANVIISGKGDYKGMKLAKNPFTISPISFDDYRILPVDITLPYKNGKQQYKKPVIYLRSTKLKSKDFTIEYAGNGSTMGVPFGDEGSYKIVIKPGPSGNITGSTTVQEIITSKIPASKMKVTYAKSYIYAGAPVKPVVTVSYKKVPLMEGKDYEVSYFNNASPGTGLIVIKGYGQFEGTAIKTFKIKK